ncbi:unnamed protein product, partial [Mesorhabditis belari]|uniref:Acyltransferase 3 domain-containing protein n=1 Tax=Mesorhabditis belari TaxID=2138241 RepID=A0AAF3F758_9BILA
MTQEKKKPKLETIQTLRALSIISVLVYHTSYWASKGDLGVHIFFVISGYLMAMILSKTGVTLESTKDFYLRRVKRIVPLYLITLLGIQIGSSLLLTKDKHRRTTQDTILALIFARNMHFEWDNISPSIHLWTVSTEMQYYLIVPIIFYFLLPMSYWKKVVMMGMIGTGSCLLYMTLPLVTGIYFMPSRLFEFLLGSLTFFTEIEIRKFFDKRSANSIPEKSIPDIVLNSAKRESFLGAIKSQFSKENLCSSISLLFFLISCVFCFLLTGTSEENDVFIVLLCAAGTIFFANIGNELLINHQVLSYIGDISYVLYLVHFPNLCLSF